MVKPNYHHYKNQFKMINPNDELVILGEEPNSVLVKTPDGEEQLLPRERMTNYVQVDSKLIPKDKVEWL